MYRNDWPIGGRIYMVCSKSREPLDSKIQIDVKMKDLEKDRPYTIPSDRIEIRTSDGAVRINGIVANVTSYKILVPNKVVQVNFADGTYERTVLQGDDVFNLDDAIRIGIAKHVGRKYYNLAGIENLALRLSYLKCIDKMIEKLHKKYKREIKQAEEAAKKEKLLKDRKAHQAKKREEKRKKRFLRKFSDLTHDSIVESDSIKQDEESITTIHIGPPSDTTEFYTDDTVNIKKDATSKSDPASAKSTRGRKHLNITRSKHNTKEEKNS